MTRQTGTGVWVAWQWDHIPIVSALFGSEIEALRHAVKNGDHVSFVPFGEDVADTLRGER